MGNKNFYLFAGVNGVGKTTLFNAMNGNVKKSFRINSDEIVREIGKWDSETDQVKAAKIAVGLRNECMEKGNSFNEETTLTGKTILKLIDKVREKNYKLHLFYVGVGSPDISKERIKKRVADGGHHIPDEVVDKRYKESLKNFEKILKKFEDMNSNTITQDMLVGDIVRLHPEVVDTLLSHGMHCLGCPSSQQESLANACMVHGLDPEKIVTAVNLAIQTEKQ